MTYKRFEDLPAWQQAMRLAHETYDLTEEMAETPNLKLPYSLRDQLERAALSVSNNIAEGFERGTTRELLNFLYISRGSAGEVRSMLCFMEQRRKYQNFKSQISKVKSTAEGCSRQLGAWIGSLRDSDISGQKHLNRSVRERKEQKQKASAMQKRLLASLPPNHPLRKAAVEAEDSER